MDNNRIDLYNWAKVLGIHCPGFSIRLNVLHYDGKDMNGVPVDINYSPVDPNTSPINFPSYIHRDEIYGMEWSVYCYDPISDTWDIVKDFTNPEDLRDFFDTHRFELQITRDEVTPIVSLVISSKDNKDVLRNWYSTDNIQKFIEAYGYTTK